MHIGQDLPTMFLSYAECEMCAEDHADPSISTSTHSEAFGPGFRYGADIGEIDGFLHLIVVDYYSFAIFE